VSSQITLKVLKLGQDVLHGGRWLSGGRLSSDRLSSFTPELSSEDIQVKKSIGNAPDMGEGAWAPVV